MNKHKHDGVIIVNHYNTNDFLFFATKIENRLLNGFSSELYIDGVRYKLCFSFDIVGLPFSDKILEKWLLVAQEEKSGYGYKSMTKKEQEKVIQYFKDTDKIKKLFSEYDDFYESQYRFHILENGGK